jgi:proteasome lid subunit RPN8/RPN11
MAKAPPRTLLITAEAYDAMIAHCVGEPALACCGILAGVPPTASVAYPLRNAANSPSRYNSDPRDLFRANVDLRKRGLAVVAIYHSCPKTAAVPGPTDLRENAYGDVPRVIVARGEVPTVRVWRLTRRYCEELTWRLRTRDGELAPEGAGADDQAPPTSPRSVLSWLFGRRTSLRIPIGRLRDLPPLEPEPSRDPAPDRPVERGRSG